MVINKFCQYIIIIDLLKVFYTEKNQNISREIKDFI